MLIKSMCYVALWATLSGCASGTSLLLGVVSQKGYPTLRYHVLAPRNLPYERPYAGALLAIVRVGDLAGSIRLVDERMAQLVDDNGAKIAQFPFVLERNIGTPEVAYFSYIAVTGVFDARDPSHECLEWRAAVSKGGASIGAVGRNRESLIGRVIPSIAAATPNSS